MLISVIVPVYNVEKYLRECLNSLLTQTYRELEIIMVDDGSSDASGKICDEYAQEYENFFVVHKENAGLGLARNTGLEYITGKYVTFLDSDDYLERDAIEILYRSLVGNNVDMCKGGFKKTSNKGEILFVRQYKNEVFEGERARLEFLPRMVGSRPDKKDSIEMCVCGALYAVAPITENNIRFPSERELISEDLVFNIDYMQHANGGCTISYCGYRYRWNRKSLSTQYRSNRFDTCCFFYSEMNKKLLSLNYDKMTILRLKRLFFVYLDVCISQEIPTVSGHDRRHACKQIGEMCKNKTLRDAIRSYPTEELGFRQRVFIKMVKFRMAHLLLWSKELILSRQYVKQE